MTAARRAPRCSPLPFGMMAVATLPNQVSPPVRRPGLAPVQPDFTTQNMTGGRQVSLTEPLTLVLAGRGGRSARLPGATVQLRNLVDQSGNPLVDPPHPPPPLPGDIQLSALGGAATAGDAVDTIFNREFTPGAIGPAGPTALVPVTRIDFCGYGLRVSAHGPIRFRLRHRSCRCGSI
jgi:hypothetical protein